MCRERTNRAHRVSYRIKSLGLWMIMKMKYLMIMMIFVVCLLIFK